MSRYLLLITLALVGCSGWSAISEDRIAEFKDACAPYGGIADIEAPFAGSGIDRLDARCKNGTVISTYRRKP